MVNITKIERLSISFGPFGSSESSDFACNESSPIIPKPTASVPEQTQNVFLVEENSKKVVDKTTIMKDTRLAVEGMKKVDPDTTKDVVENSKVDGGETFNLEDGKKNLTGYQSQG